MDGAQCYNVVDSVEGFVCTEKRIEGGNCHSGHVDRIMAEFESDPLIHTKSLNLVLCSKGFLKRRKTLEVLGTAESSTEKGRALEIVQRQAGDGYDVEDKIIVIGGSTR